MAERNPLPRGGDDMDLPAGKTCADCAHCRRCTTMFGHIPADESCDWSPSRFTQKRAEVASAERRYHVTVVRDSTGEKTYMTRTPVTHSEGCVLLSKLTDYPWRRKLLEEVANG
nr:hypothetical protein [Pseudomonas oleovorans]